MTVQPQDTYQYYSGPITAGTTLSITDFAFASNSHVSVKVRGEADNWLYGTDYLVEGENTAERSLTVKKDVAEGAVLAVYLDVPITQKVSPEEGGNFPAVTQEFTLDKLTYICQMLDARLSRAFQVSIDTNFNGTLFDPTNKAGKAIKINSTGTGLEYSVEDIDTISATMRELFNQVTALHDETGTWKDLAKDWATKTSGEVVEGQGYGAKKYADDAKQSVEGFDANVAEKTNAFNTNATEKTGAFDTNATEKTGAFDTNAIEKTNAFNTNATEKTTLVGNIAKAAEASATAAATSEANALASETIAETYSGNSQIWAEGTDEQVETLGGEHSAKEWARQASQGQIQADWEQSDTTKTDYIKNKPTKLSDFTDDLGTSPTHTHSQYLISQDISGKEDTSNKGIANGYAELDNTGKVPTSQLPKINSTMLNLKSDLMKANGKKVQFVCSEDIPVTVKTIDGTTKTVSYIPELDLSSFGVGNRTIALGENNNAKQCILNNSTLAVSTDGWISGFSKTAHGYYHPMTYPTTKEEIFPITFEFKVSALPTANQTLAGTPEQHIWAVNLNTTGTLSLYLGATGDTTWGIASNATSTEVVEPNVPYLVTLDYDGATYTLKVRNMAQEGATDVTFVTVASTTLIAGTSTTRWGTNLDYVRFFDGSILGQSIKVGTIIDNSDFLKQSVLGVATLTADGITNITNYYQTESINPLEEVIIHTESSAKDIDYDKTSKLNLAPFNFSKVNWSDNEKVNANTVSTYAKDGVFFANSIAEVTYTDGGIATNITTNIIPVKAGDSIKSPVAGKIYFYY